MTSASAWSSGRINTLNANWANSFGLGEFLRMKWVRLALDETDVVETTFGSSGIRGG